MATRPQASLPFASAGHSSLLLGLLVLCLLPGCGRASAQPTGAVPASAAASSESAPETLEQAEAELEQARQQLVQLGGGLPTPAPAAAPVAQNQASGATSRVEASSAKEEAKRKRPVEAEAAPPPAPEAPAARRADKSAEDDAAPAESHSNTRDESPCVNTCKAYASLLRAKSAVCRLDVPNGARCARAEGIVRDATPQVQSCQCAP